MNIPNEPAQLKRVEWLVGLLDLENINQAYAMINDGRIPSNCIVRLGRWLRVNPVAVMRWINGETEGAEEKSEAYCDARR